MTAYLHSGGAGDIIYSLPFVRHMGRGPLFVKTKNPFNQSCDIHRAVKRLLELQPFVESVSEYDAGRKFFEHDPALPIDMDLDRFRDVFNTNMLLPLSYFHAFKVEAPKDWRKPWLKVDPVSPCGGRKFAVISLTSRYRGSGLDWNAVLETASALYGNVFFVGLQGEYWEFIKTARRYVPWIPTIDLLEAASVVAAADAVYCNQNATLTIAQALGKKCFLDPEPGQKSCILGLEEILYG